MNKIYHSISSFIQRFEEKDHPGILLAISDFHNRVCNLVDAIESGNIPLSRELLHTLQAESVYLSLDHLGQIVQQMRAGNAKLWLPELKSFRDELGQCLEKISGK